MVGDKGLWSKWHAFAWEHPDEAFAPKKVPDSRTGLEFICIAVGPPDFPDLFVLHPYRMVKDQTERVFLQPGPYVMASTLTEARALLPVGAQHMRDVPLVGLYREAWLT